jgi:UDP-N-acetylmuramate--alanine ligase
METMGSEPTTLESLQAALSPQTVVRRREPMARRTTLRVGGPADYYLEPASEEDLAHAVRFCSRNQVPITMLGRGSNLLIRDGGIRGVVICLAQPAFCSVEAEGTRIRCGSGARLKQVAAEARRQGLEGMEFLEGIPGCVGGALRMNAGAMESSVFSILDSLRFMDYSGLVFEAAAADVDVQYRNCPLLKTHIALAATLEGRASTPESVSRRMQAFSKKRWDSQPAAASAGCIFKNPKTIPAGRLVEELGLKGTRVGGAVVSDVHGNFIVNEGQATAGDILRLIQIIRGRAKSERGIDLETEVQILGEETGP